MQRQALPADNQVAIGAGLGVNLALRERIADIIGLAVFGPAARLVADSAPGAIAVLCIGNEFLVAAPLGELARRHIQDQVMGANARDIGVDQPAALWGFGGIFRGGLVGADAAIRLVRIGNCLLYTSDAADAPYV